MSSSAPALPSSASFSDSLVKPDTSANTIVPCSTHHGSPRWRPDTNRGTNGVNADAERDGETNITSFWAIYLRVAIAETLDAGETRDHVVHATRTGRFPATVVRRAFGGQIMNKLIGVGTVLALVTSVVIVGGSGSGIVSASAAATPELVPGNPRCADLGLQYGYKVDQGARAGTYNLAKPNGAKVTIEPNDGFVFSWSTQIDERVHGRSDREGQQCRQRVPVSPRGRSRRRARGSGQLERWRRGGEPRRVLLRPAPCAERPGAHACGHDDRWRPRCAHR